MDNKLTVTTLNRTESHKKNHEKTYIFLLIIFTMFLFTVMPVFATGTGTTDMWTKASEIMKDVYNKILGISTIVAVVTAAVALLMMNFSKNGRTVDESRAWLKRIVITWAILNGMGFIMTYLTAIFQGGQYTP